MVSCSNCGIQVQEGLQVCPNCGQAIVAAAAPSQQQYQPIPQPNEPTPQYQPMPQTNEQTPQYQQPPQYPPPPQPTPPPQYQQPPQYPSPQQQYQQPPQYPPPPQYQQPPQYPPQQQYQQQGYPPPPGYGAPVDPYQDIQNNKGIAVLCYIIFFIPLLMGAHNTSQYVKYHANQGTILFLFYIAWAVVYAILTAILTAILGWRILLVFMTILGLLWLVPVALMIVGIVNAATGKVKPLPVIGTMFTIIK